MASEQEKGHLLKSIHIDLAERSILFEAADQTHTKLTLTPEGIVYSASHLPRLPDTPAAPDAHTTPLQNAKETEETIAVSATLLDQPRLGHPDRSGRPTCFALLESASEESPEEKKTYAASFTRDTFEQA